MISTKYLLGFFTIFVVILQFHTTISQMGTLLQNKHYGQCLAVNTQNSFIIKLDSCTPPINETSLWQYNYTGVYVEPGHIPTYQLISTATDECFSLLFNFERANLILIMRPCNFTDVYQYWYSGPTVDSCNYYQMFNYGNGTANNLCIDLFVADDNFGIDAETDICTPGNDTQLWTALTI